MIRRWMLPFFLMGMIPSVFLASEPAIRNLDLRGLRIGGTTTLAIDGDDLGTIPRLLLPFAAKQTLKPGATDKRAVFEITLPGDVEAGYYHLRVISENGVSLPVVIGVDSLLQQAVTAAVTEWPVAVHGMIAGGGTVETKFQGKAKQKVMVEVEAQRLGSKLRPIIHLSSPKKLQLTWAWASPILFGDARLEAILPEDGTYTVSLHDAEYAAAAPAFFRLKIGAWSFVDQVFPPVLAKNSAAKVELLGMAAPISIDINMPKSLEVVPLAWPKKGVWSGPRPFVTVSSHAEFVKQPATGKLQDLPAGDVGVSGQLLTPNEEDRYRVQVVPGKKVRLEVFAERIGSPIDAALVVRDEKGTQLARAEDSPGTLDPVLEYTVPEKVTAIVVGVVDAQGRGGPRGIYRLTIHPQGLTTSQESFKLRTLTQRISLPAGGHAVLPVQVERRGYLGKIELGTALPLPAGVRLTGAIIPPGADGALVTVERGETPFAAVIMQWHGRSDTGDALPVILKGHPLERLQPWLATEIALAPTHAKASDFLVDWRDLKLDAALVPGSKLVLPIKTTRTNPKTTVKLTLLTSQVTPLLNNQPDPTKALRQEKAVETPANMPNGDVTVLVPVELAAPVYDVTIQAELLAADKKVLATAYAPVRRMAVRLPLVVKLDGPNRIEAPFDPKKATTVKIQGKIERLEGLKADVALSLAGLPAGAKADTPTLKGSTTDFTLNVVLPPNTPAGEMKGLKLTGSFAPDSKLPNVRVRSRDLEITLVLKASTK